MNYQFSDERIHICRFETAWFLLECLTVLTTAPLLTLYNWICFMCMIQGQIHQQVTVPIALKMSCLKRTECICYIFLTISCFEMNWNWGKGAKILAIGCICTSNRIGNPDFVFTTPGCHTISKFITNLHWLQFKKMYFAIGLIVKHALSFDMVATY